MVNRVENRGGKSEKFTHTLKTSFFGSNTTSFLTIIVFKKQYN